MMQYGLTNNRQQRVAAFVAAVCELLVLSATECTALQKTLDMLSNAEYSDALDAVCEIAGEKSAALTRLNIEEQLREERKRSNIE